MMFLGVDYLRGIAKTCGSTVPKTVARMKKKKKTKSPMRKNDMRLPSKLPFCEISTRRVTVQAGGGGNEKRFKEVVVNLSQYLSVLVQGGIPINKQQKPDYSIQSPRHSNKERRGQLVRAGRVLEIGACKIGSKSCHFALKLLFVTLLGLETDGMHHVERTRGADQ